MTERIEEPMRELIVTVAAWRRLISKAKELTASNDTKMAGFYILHQMEVFLKEAERDMKENEEKIEEMKE